MDFGETVTSLCSETGLSVFSDGIDASDMRAEEVIRMQEEDHLAVASPAVKAADKVCYLCNILVLTVVQACSVTSAFWQCVVWHLDVTVR